MKPTNDFLVTDFEKPLHIQLTNVEYKIEDDFKKAIVVCSGVGFDVVTAEPFPIRFELDRHKENVHLVSSLGLHIRTIEGQPRISIGMTGNFNHRNPVKHETCLDIMSDNTKNCLQCPYQLECLAGQFV